MSPSRTRSSQFPLALALAAVAFAAVGERLALAQGAPAVAWTPPPAHIAIAPSDSSGQFLGTWQLTAYGTEEGDLPLTLGVVRHETGLVASVTNGPALKPRSVRAAGDSLMVALTLGSGKDPADDYRLVLRARGDSATGTWAGPDGGGRVAGRRAAR